MSTEKVVIVDVDGTVALRNGRKPFDWTKIEQDKPNLSVIELVNRIASTGVKIIFVSGREQKYHNETVKWLEKFHNHPILLYCRRDQDFRKDELVKCEIFRDEILGKYEVIAVFEDRNRMVEMWRELLGLTCLQVAPGNF